MQLQPGIFQVNETDFAHVIDVWEASVRATHHFVSEADILRLVERQKPGGML